MSFALYCIIFGILVFRLETETAPPGFLSTPHNPSYAIEGEDFTLVWVFALDGSLFAAQFSNVTGGGTDYIGQGNGTGNMTIKPKYEARFKGKAENKRAELKILAVQLSDEGTYQVDLASRRSYHATLISNSVKVIVISPPSNIVTSSDQSITAPTKLTLNCSADGKPKPTITWTRVSDNASVSMPLNITAGKNEESYRCTAYNGVGNPLTKVIIITIQSPPMVTLAQKVFVGREKNASLKCVVEGNPTPTISWSPCDAGKILCDKQYLNISKVQSARANYTCTARNYLGMDSVTTAVFIGGKNVSLRLTMNGECAYSISIWHTLEKELLRVFANTTQNYTGAGLLNLSFTGNKFGSLIFDVVLKFTTEVAEDHTIFIIQNAIVDGKLGELSGNILSVIGIPHFPQTTIPAPTCTTPESDDNKTGLIIGVVLGSIAIVALILAWWVYKKYCSETKKEVSDNTDAAQGRKGKDQNGADQGAYERTSMLPHSDRRVENGSQSTVQTSLMNAQVDQSRRTSNKGGAAQYAETAHVKSGGSFSKKSSSEPKEDPRNEELVVELGDLTNQQNPVGIDVHQVLNFT